MKKGLMFGAALVGLALVTGFSSCKKDDEEPAIEEGCCVLELDLGILGSSSSKQCEDGTVEIDGEDESVDAYSEEEWGVYKETLIAFGAKCN